MNTLLYPYNGGSKSAKALAAEMGIKRIRRTNSTYTGEAGDVVINWGCTKLPLWRGGVKIINNPANVLVTHNKLTFFEACYRVGLQDIVVPYTVDKDRAFKWLEDGYIVIARTKLTGHSGAGIEVLEGDGGWIDAPLYTRYIDKRDEYRIHIYQDAIIDMQQKKLKHGAEGGWFIRNKKTGYAYCREDIVVPLEVKQAAFEAMEVSGLDFGAVDVIMETTHNQSAYVLEINSAPGLEGQTVKSYAKAIGGGE